MTANTQRRDQRRRLLASWTRSAPQPSEAASGPQPTAARYAPDALPERQRGPAVLLPTGLGGIALAAVAILVPVIAATTVGAWETIVGRPLVATTGRFARTLAALAACCDPHGTTSLQAWLAQTWLLVGAAVALVVRLMRRHRLEDFRGGYRAWTWMAAMLGLTALAGTVPVGNLVGAAIADASGIVLGPQGVGWWLTLSATAWLAVALWAILPLHERMATAIWLGLALVAWGAAAATEWLAAGRDAWIVAGRAAWTMAAALAAVAMLAAARAVIREVRGLATARSATRRPKPARKAPAAAAARETPVRFDEADHADAEEETDGSTSSTDYVDGSEPEQRHLSKAERKRLKKLARMNQAVA